MARNSLLNLVGQGTPLIIALIAMPFIVQGLGTERFGLLTLSWAIMGYFTIFDLGLGRATTKFVAEALAKGKEDQVNRIIWTAVTFQIFFGLFGAFMLFWITDYLVENALNIPTLYLDEAKDTFHLLALAIPVVLVSSSFNGVMEAMQRFDIINAVRIPSSILIYLLPLIGLNLGMNLPGIIFLSLLARFLSLIVLIILSNRVIIILRNYSISFSQFFSLFTYGGWITITSVINPFLTYLDRFLIGSIISMTAVAYYTAPYEAVIRLSIISSSLTMTLFPAFSALDSKRERKRLEVLFARSIKYILFSIGPFVIIIYLFANRFLQMWLGIDFAIKSTVVMQVLAIGVLVNALALLPYTLLQGIGRPDLPAKFHLLELPIYLCVAWILISSFGIAGAAAAWTFRVVLDAILLFAATFKLCKYSLHQLEESGTIRATFWLLALGIVSLEINAFSHELPILIQFLLISVLFMSFIYLSWNYAFDELDRKAILKVVNFRGILGEM